MRICPANSTFKVEMSRAISFYDFLKSFIRHMTMANSDFHFCFGKKKHPKTSIFIKNLTKNEVKFVKALD